MKLTFVTDVDAAKYDEFVTQHPQCNLLQSSTWADVKAEWRSTLTAVEDADGNIVVAGLVLKRPLPLGYSFWYVPHGPIGDYENVPVMQAYLRGLGNYAKKSRAIAVRIDPPVPVKQGVREDFPQEYGPEATALRESIEAAGFRHRGFFTGLHQTLQPRFMTAMLRPDDASDILKTMPRRTRDFYKRARQRQADVYRGTIADLDKFLSVIHATEEEKDITLRPRAYYERIMNAYGDDAVLILSNLDIKNAIEEYTTRIADLAEQLEATDENAKNKRRQLTDQIKSRKKRLQEMEECHEIDGDEVTLAGCLSVSYGRGFEMLYAGTNRDYGTITAQDLVWVETLQHAFDGGADYVSLGGVDGSLEDSLLEFKSRFNAVIFEKIGEFDLVVNKPIYAAFDWYMKRKSNET